MYNLFATPCMNVAFMDEDEGILLMSSVPRFPWRLESRPTCDEQQFGSQSLFFFFWRRVSGKTVAGYPYLRIGFYGVRLLTCNNKRIRSTLSTRKLLTSHALLCFFSYIATIYLTQKPTCSSHGQLVRRKPFVPKMNPLAHCKLDPFSKSRGTIE